MKKYFITVLAAVLFVSVNISAQNSSTINLKFNLPKGSGYDYSMDMAMNLKGNAGGQAMNVSNNMVMGYHFKVLDDSAGWKKISSTISRIAMNMNTGGVNIDYDSDKPVDTSNMANSAISKVFGALKGGSFMFTLNEKGEIGSVTGIDEMKTKMMSAAPDADAMAGGLSSAFNEESFKQNMQQAFGVYPGKPVKPGDSWTSTMNTNNGGMQMKLDNTYTLESVANNVASVKVNSVISSDAGMPVKGTMTGIMKYDVVTGIPVDGNLDMIMNMNFDAGGQSTSMDMDMKMKVSGKKF